MGNLIALVLVVGLISFVVFFVVRKRNRPEQRLLRDFKRVDKAIMKSIDKSNKKEANKLLDACEKHLNGLITARENYKTLGTMQESASEMTGRNVGSKELMGFEVAVADQVAEFFANLTRISTTVSLGSDKTMAKLRGFASELEEQREALNQMFETEKEK